MKNRYTVFLLYSCAAFLMLICAVQIYGLSGHPQMEVTVADRAASSFRTLQIITLILSVMAVSMLLSREEINRGLKRKAYTDITGIMNKHACLEKMTALDCNDSTLNIGFAMFDLNNLKKVNDFYGHEEGDRLIQNFVLILRQASGKRFFLGRFGGDEFVAIAENCTREVITGYLERIKELTAEFNLGQPIRLSYACGWAISTREHYYLMDELLKEADKRMYENKKTIKSGELFELNQISKIIDLEKNGISSKDELTSLYDYESFVTVVGKVLRVTDSQTTLAVICSDILNFGYVNDTYGHKEGNTILRLLAMEASSQPFCLCACRMYSDHFAFLADFTGLSHDEAAQQVQTWSEKFSHWINEAYRGSRAALKSGIYFISNTGEPPERMLGNARYAHKSARSGLCSVCVYTQALSQSERRRSEIIHSFQSAVEREEFEVYVQPQVRCSDKQVCGAEALVRWSRPDRGLCYPDEFIPVLEQTGDIVDLDFFVYRKVFEFQHGARMCGRQPIPISVNVSRVHLLNSEKFLARLRLLHEEFPIPASLVMFELTESAYIQEINHAKQLIAKLHHLGYRVSMDDFGSGYSSLKVLQTTPFDEIKFDKAFLRKNPEEKEDCLFLHIIELVKRLGAPVVCEGAETQAHVELLERSACDIIQGYYYYRPFPLGELHEESASPVPPVRTSLPRLCS